MQTVKLTIDDFLDIADKAAELGDWEVWADAMLIVLQLQESGE